ncbi:zinc finger protein 271 isoform X2 [Cryptotermes secundus]|uniref:zinc finger protein 271 isoform X2 n=1 Tax=Cryptotermes secundus TaxID=105785 RepID=UPI000CD7C2C4|nr:zinc finger protein 271 isoform X2 [Cryptotermes secundus]
MAVCDILVRKTFMNLEIFLQKAATLDIFETLIFNYKVKIGLLDPLTAHFLAIVTELASQLQLLSQETSEQKDFVDTLQISVCNSDLNIRGSDSRMSEPVVLSIKTEDSTGKKDSLEFSLFNDDNNHSEIRLPIKNSKLSVSTVSSKEAGSTRLKQRSEKLSQKKSENQGKPVRKTETGSEIYEVSKCFKCEMCNSFVTETKLVIHVAKCQKDVSSTTKAKSRGSKIYSCNHCEMVFTARRFLTAHTSRTHKVGNDIATEEISNGLCTVSEDSTGLNDEIQLLPENLPFLCCKTCLVVYKTHKEFEVHICKNGGNCLNEGTILDKYVQLSGNKLITNLERLKALKKYKCGLCHEEYRSMRRMSYHLPRCTQGPYKCEICTEEYMFKKDLNLHKKKLHKGANSFFCDECGLTFKFRTSLQKHKVNRHETEQGPFSCEECDKRFAKRIQLTNHKINTHRVERKFLCQMCGNRFSNYGSLMAHLDTHTETRRFCCNYCSKKFRQKEKLKYHTRIHTGERPHLCQTCGKGFIRKSKLDEHMRRHRGEKRYHCSVCDKSYAAGWDLKLHNKKQHPDSVASVTTLAASPRVLNENVSETHLSCDKNDNEDPDDPPPIADPNEANETVAATPEHTTATEKLTEPMNVDSIQTDSQADSDKSKILVQLNSNQQQDSKVVIKSENVDKTNSSILVQLNRMQMQNMPITQENSNSKILVQLDPTQIQNQPVILNNNANSFNSKIIVQLDTTQHQQPLSQNNSVRDSSPSRILLQIDPSQTQGVQTALTHSGNTTTNSSRILLQLDPGQNQALPPNTVFTVADAIHLAPLIDDVTSQYIQLTAAQPDNPVPSTDAVTSRSNNVPLHIQLPMSAIQIPVSAISQQGSTSTGYEFQSLSVPGQPGLLFTSMGFDVSSITY